MEEMNSLKEELENKIIAYYTDIWSDIRDLDYQKWLNNFVGGDEEKINALYLLSKFTYFGNQEIREMLKAIYRDLYKYPIIKNIRIKNDNTINDNFIKKEFNTYLEKTRFLGVGNPSESGVHLLYYFRQENNLSRDKFLHAHELFSSFYSKEEKCQIQSWAHDNIEHIVFIDDFCGNGVQAINYIGSVIQQIKDLNESCQVDYYVMVATKNGLENVLKSVKVDNAKAIFELDESFHCFSSNSRYFINLKKGITKDLCKNICQKYGEKRFKDAKSPFGYNNDELLISFFHNTPNNTLPIFWTDEKGWYPIFNRSIKIYKNV